MSLLRKLFICPKPSSGGASGQASRHKDTDLEKNPGGAETETEAEAEAEGSEQTETECAVCQDKLTEPCTIPCGNQHVFCLACLKGLTTHSPHRNHFLCPLCRKRVRIPLGGVAAFRNHKTLGQMLRSKLPDLRPRPRRRPRRSRSGMRSTDYLTVSFPVLAYPDQLELDILTTLYARRDGQPDRLVEAILGEINNRPGSPRDGNRSVWVSEELVPSEDSDQEEEVSDGESPPAAELGRNRPASSGESGLMNVEDLDMSVVLQIIADMEENERRREASQGAGHTAAPGSAPSHRAEACSETPQAGEAGNGRARRPENMTSQRPENVNAQRPENAITSQRPETSSTSQRSETGNTTPQRRKAGNTSAQRSEISNDKLQRPVSADATSEQQKISNATQQRPDNSNAQLRRPEPGMAKSRRAELGHSEPQGREPGNAGSPSAGADKPASQRPRSTDAASVKPDSGHVALKRQSISAVPLHRPEVHGSSADQADIGQPSSGRSPRGKTAVPEESSSSHAFRQNGASARTDMSRASNAHPKKSDRCSTGVVSARSSSPQQPPSGSSSNDGLEEPRPVNGKSENAAERQEQDARDYRFLPRPRMGSFRMAIAAGQVSPTSDEDSPPLFAPPQHNCQVPESASAVVKHSAQPSARRTLSHSGYKTKTEIGERPLRFKYFPRPKSYADASLAPEQRSGEHLVRMMDGADRDSGDQVVAMMDSDERCRAQEKRRVRTPAKNSHAGLPPTDMRFQDFRRDRDETNHTSVNGDLPIPCAWTSQGSHPKPRPQTGQTTDGRKPEHSTEQASAVPLTASDGFLSKQRRLQESRDKPNRTTMSSSELQKKTASSPVALPGNETREDAGHSAQQARADPDDSEEWTRRIRGLQRRVISQTCNRPPSGDAHRPARVQGPAVRPTRHSWTCASPRLADDCMLVVDIPNDSLDVFHV